MADPPAASPASRSAAAAGGYLYWSNTTGRVLKPGNGMIVRARLNGTGVNQKFITGASLPAMIVAYRGYLYWANIAPLRNGAGTIGGARLDSDTNPDSDAHTDTNSDANSTGSSRAGANGVHSDVHCSGLHADLHPVVRVDSFGVDPDANGSGSNAIRHQSDHPLVLASLERLDELSDSTAAFDQRERFAPNLTDARDARLRASVFFYDRDNLQSQTFAVNPCYPSVQYRRKTEIFCSFGIFSQTWCILTN